MAQFKAPEGCTGITIGAASFEVDKKGLVDLPDGVDIEQVMAHGFIAAPAKAKSKDE